MYQLTVNGITYTMKNIESKAAKAFGHDKESNTLCVIFSYAPNKAYIYSNVNYQKHTYVNHAESFGAHFHNKIRNDKVSYPFQAFDIA